MPAHNGYSRLQIAPQWLVFALVIQHFAGVPYHQFVQRDGTLARMRRAQG